MTEPAMPVPLGLAEHRDPHGSAAGSALLRITSPHFVAGILPGMRAAPILYYMRDWPEARIRAYCARRGWLVERL